MLLNDYREGEGLMQNQIKTVLWLKKKSTYYIGRN